VTEGGGQLVRLALVGAAGVAAYQFVYRPWALRRDLEELTRQAALAAAARGGGNVTGAAGALVAAACTAGAAAYGAPPTVAGPICQGLAPIAIKGAVVAVKGAIVAGKVIGKGVGTGAKAVGSTVKKGAKVVHSAAHGFGLWGLGDLPYDLGDFEDPHGGPRPRVDRTTQRARARTKQAAAFYLRHL